MSRRLPAFIAPADVERGDTITVSTVRGDVKETATATVDRIMHSVGTVSFISPGGNAFGMFRYGSPAKVLLIARGGAVEQEPLFDLERLTRV